MVSTSTWDKNAAPRAGWNRASLKILGAKWTLLVLRDIGFLRLDRFGEIVRNNAGLTPRVLSRRLRNMQKEGLIDRTVKKDMVTYRLTPRGEDAVYILLAFLRYGLKYHVSILNQLLNPFHDFRT